MTQSALVETPASGRPTDTPFWYAQGDPWTLCQDGWDAERSLYFETIFSLANGYMGFRGYPEEADNVHASCREGYLAGIFAKLPPVARKLVVHDFSWDSRQMIALPEIFGALITLDGEAFSLAAGEVSNYRQTLDLRSGELRREVTWMSPGGLATQLRFTRFLSAETPHLAVQRIDLKPINWSGTAEIWWDYEVAERTVFRCGDPAKANPACPTVAIHAVGTEGSATVHGLVETIGSGHKIAYRSRVVGAGVKSSSEPSGLLSQVATQGLEAGEETSWVRYTAVATTRDVEVSDPRERVREVLIQAEEAGFELLVDRQRHVWAERWAGSDVEIEGPARDQALIRFGVFSLLQVAPFHASNLSIPARCYAYNRYNGLYFWDGEIFLLPFYQACAPKAARNLLEFRCDTLPGARRNAAALGAEGAIFPWQGDSDEGLEQAPWGLEKYLWHQNADIVYAFDQYARATGDKAFMFSRGLEVLAETARFWCSQCELGDDGRYHLEATVGPDEAEEHGPDNGYTCLMLRRSLEISLRWWKQARLDEPATAEALAERLELDPAEFDRWEQLAAGICIPEVPDCPGVPLQDAYLLQRKREDISAMTVPEFWQRRGVVQVIKQADIVLAMYLLEDSFTRDEIRRGYEFYEPRTLHVSSLSYNTHAIVAANIGHRDEAYDYFHRAAGLDLDNLRNATKDGLHAAALGAVWQMAIPGFAGMRVRLGELSFQPNLPDAWSEIRFPLQFRGWQLRFQLGGGRYRVEVSGQGQTDARLTIGDSAHLLGEAPLLQGTY